MAYGFTFFLALGFYKIALKPKKYVAALKNRGPKTQPPMYYDPHCKDPKKGPFFGNAHILGCFGQAQLTKRVHAKSRDLKHHRMAMASTFVASLVF